MGVCSDRSDQETPSHARMRIRESCLPQRAIAPHFQHFLSLREIFYTGKIQTAILFFSVFFILTAPAVTLGCLIPRACSLRCGSFCPISPDVTLSGWSAEKIDHLLASLVSSFANWNRNLPVRPEATRSSFPSVCTTWQKFLDTIGYAKKVAADTHINDFHCADVNLWLEYLPDARPCERTEREWQSPD